MFFIRTVKTASGATAVQVIRYKYRKRIIAKHLGSAHTDEDIASLKNLATQWIEKEARQQTLFPEEKKNTPSLPIVSIDKLRNLGFRYTFAYETLNRLLNIFSLEREKYQMLLDLVVMRIIKPASKLESFTLISRYFGINHKRTDFYRSLPAIVALKTIIEKNAIDFAQAHFSFNFQVVFYDVTTLYFESFTEDEDVLDNERNIIEKGLKRNGYSKDHKHSQPQIVIGLIVTREGFPIAYEVFEGNTFEGDTFIPTIIEFKKKYAIDSLTVVADAAMISVDNVEKLKIHLLSYIVGARMHKLKQKEIRKINTDLIGGVETEKELMEKDSYSTRIETERGLLICDFSFKRYLKDKREMEKQILKARIQLEKNEGIKRVKFLKNKKGQRLELALNTNLINQAKLLLGIKGYYTNLTDAPDKTIIEQYHSLWHVEKAFRIAKSDLQTRPIYHFKKQAIEAHILICFMALVLCSYMELKTKKSTKAIIDHLMQITDARILNTLTNEEIILRSELSTEIEDLLKKLSLPH